MSKEIYISSTPHETRLAIVEDEALTEIYYERENEYTLAGSIYNGRVTRVLPGMQSSFVDIGLERDAFLYITDFMEEAPDPEEFDTVSSADRPPRLNGGERQDEPRGSDRGDRGRGRRGGRDRDRNQDRQGSAEPSSRQPGAEHEQQDRTPAEAVGAVPVSPVDSSDAGEGAPGADGGRRWRGRRGRRRGRGPGGQAGEATPGTSAGYSELESSSENEPLIEIDAPVPQPSDTSLASTGEGPRGDRFGDASRRDQREQARGNQRFASPRRDRDQRSQRAPSDFYGADSGDVTGTGPIADAYSAEPGPEPLILPGESLSKYRKGEEAPAQPAAAVSSPAVSVQVAPPANLYTLAEGWDGGETLPGETLSRRHPADSRSEARTDSRSGSRHDFDRGPRRDARGDSRARDSRDARPDRRIAPPSAATAVDHEPVNPYSPAAEVAQAPIAPSADHAPVQVPVDQAPEVAQAPMVPDEAPVTAPVAAEYEPTEASASHRIDPVSVSEYRQSAPTLEPSAAPPPQVQEAATDVAAEPSGPAAEAHDVTSIHATGEMLSEPAEIVPVPSSHPAPMEVPEPASPIRHEGAVVLAYAVADFPAPGVGIGTAEVEDSASGRGGFAPGSGPLVEEIVDEEDSDSATLQASSIEEMEEDLEEETLEGAADLGTMLREMSIDHITRTSPEIEEEDDSEQDDLEEDDLEEEDEDDLEEQEEESSEEFETGDQAGSEADGQPEDEFQEQAARSGSAADQEFFESQFGQTGVENRSEAGDGQTAEAEPRRNGFGRDADRRGGRRDGRRDGRRSRSDRPGDRGHSGHGNGRGRHSVQSTNLPAISDLLKPGQEILVQIAKEPIAKKGARITSHIALPGRFLVFMPTVNHTGVSRKIESDGERRRLKEILLSEKGDASGGFIVRTAAEGASEEELRSDLRFLLNLWADIKARSDSSKSPALIYHDLNLIERILRDQVTDNFSAIWVDTRS